MDKEYIGDSVYAQHDGYHIILTTENGYGPTNTIALEPAVLARLNAYAASIKPVCAKPPEDMSNTPEDIGNPDVI